MKKTTFNHLAIIIMAASVLSCLFSCKKDDCTNSSNNGQLCKVVGAYLGTYTNQLGQTGNFYYVLNEDYFVSSAASPTAPLTAFGSYSNTCDSVKIKVWNSVNSNYYYLAGKFSNNLTIINGIYKNLTTTSETGSFIMTKQ